MKVLSHHIYEYKKGIRHLVLHTMRAEFREQAEAKLLNNNISFTIQEINPSRINVFFGDQDCVDVIRSFGFKKLNTYTPEEDFILGILLGYDPIRQCQRYMQISKKERSFSLRKEDVLSLQRTREELSTITG